MRAPGGALPVPRPPRAAARPRGHIEKLKSGSLRVRVYAGVDAVTGKELYLREVVPFAGDEPATLAVAEQLRLHLLTQIANGENPLSNITIAELLRVHFEECDVEPKSLSTLRGYARKHIDDRRIGAVRINDVLEPTALDAFYAELFRCRDHCSGGLIITHWTARDHSCDRRCRQHVCRPLSKWTVRKIHFMLNSAFKRAVRRKWALRNPMEHADVPSAPPPRPQPPSTEEAARIVNAAWVLTDYGSMVWVAMTTGARLGELCALRWSDLDVHHHGEPDESGHDCVEADCEWTLDIRRSIGHDGMKVWTTDTKEHQHRRVALDAATVAVLLSLRASRQRDGRLSGIPFRTEHYLFHHRHGPDVHRKPGAMSTHYRKFTTREGIDTSFHKLRHYSATELIAAGVDVRTVAGRLGHAGGGTTTLKIYAAWVAEADQRAARTLSGRMPPPPVAPKKPYRPLKFAVLAETLRHSIADGEIAVGEPLPTMKVLAGTHEVSINAAHAAVQQLRTWGYVDVARGKRATVRSRESWQHHHEPDTTTEAHAPNNISARACDSAAEVTSAGHESGVGEAGKVLTAVPTPELTVDTDNAVPPLPGRTVRGSRLLQLTLRCDQQAGRTLMVTADPDDMESMTTLIADITAVARDDDTLTGVLYLDIAEFGSSALITSVLLGQVAGIRSQHLAATG